MREQVNELEDVKEELAKTKQQLNIVTDEVFKMRLAQTEQTKHKKHANILMGIVLFAWTLLFVFLYNGV